MGHPASASVSGGRLGEKREQFLLDFDAVLVESKSMQGSRSCWNQEVSSAPGRLHGVLSEDARSWKVEDTYALTVAGKFVLLDYVAGMSVRGMSYRRGYRPKIAFENFAIQLSFPLCEPFVPSRSRGHKVFPDVSRRRVCPTSATRRVPTRVVFAVLDHDPRSRPFSLFSGKQTDPGLAVSESSGSNLFQLSYGLANTALFASSGPRSHATPIKARDYAPEKPASSCNAIQLRAFRLERAKCASVLQRGSIESQKQRPALSHEPNSKLVRSSCYFISSSRRAADEASARRNFRREAHARRKRGCGQSMRAGRLTGSSEHRKGAPAGNFPL
ncbi:hypothetical protein K0M31_011295 [Melipona bicolor]|uniref:Uncharacterized protein n=1 Tax=Melipona bicolor TaxID=60889 RepID=A0AA40KUR6_9HYME|nr:hypothetical protein K0M31_011295 [Melipona bicolor]